MTPEVERIRTLFAEEIEAKIALVDVMSEVIATAGRRLADCLLQDGKIFVCGTGASVANSLHFSSAMLHCYDVERPPLPVINLAQDAYSLIEMSNEGHFEHVFARQIQALGLSNDVLMVLTTTGNSKSIDTLVHAAHDRGLDIIALSGRDGGILANHLGPEDIEIRVPGVHSARIREVHLFVLHCLCDFIDRALFGS